MTSSDPFQNWPPEQHRITDAAHLHALGQFSIVYNMMEDIIYWIFNHYFPADKDYSERLFHDLNNRVRVDMLKAIIGHTETDDAVHHAMLHALRCFDICTDNRNILMHAMVGETDETVFQIAKRSRTNPLKFVHYKIPLTEMRSIADECAEVYIFMVRLVGWIQEEQWEEGPGPFPETPVQPHRLSSFPPEEAGKDGAHQPGA
jgi:hypothetical protein